MVSEPPPTTAVKAKCEECAWFRPRMRMSDGLVAKDADQARRFTKVRDAEDDLEAADASIIADALLPDGELATSPTIAAHCVFAAGAFFHEYKNFDENCSDWEQNRRLSCQNCVERQVPRPPEAPQKREVEIDHYPELPWDREWELKMARNEYNEEARRGRESNEEWRRRTHNNLTTGIEFYTNMLNHNGQAREQAQQKVMQLEEDKARHEARERQRRSDRLREERDEVEKEHKRDLKEHNDKLIALEGNEIELILSSRGILSVEPQFHDYCTMHGDAFYICGWHNFGSCRHHREPKKEVEKEKPDHAPQADKKVITVEPNVCLEQKETDKHEDIQQPSTLGLQDLKPRIGLLHMLSSPDVPPEMRAYAGINEFMSPEALKAKQIAREEIVRKSLSKSQRFLEEFVNYIAEIRDRNTPGTRYYPLRYQPASERRKFFLDLRDEIEGNIENLERYIENCKKNIKWLSEIENRSELIKEIYDFIISANANKPRARAIIKSFIITFTDSSD